MNKTKTYDVDFWLMGTQARWSTSARDAASAERKARGAYGRNITIIDIKVR